jgi:hypothetical protein
MRNRTDYENAISVIGLVVRAWNPYRLIESGAPADEFDAEIARLATYVPRISNAADTAKALSEVFSAAFEPALFTLEYAPRLDGSYLLGFPRRVF